MTPGILYGSSIHGVNISFHDKSYYLGTGIYKPGAFLNGLNARFSTDDEDNNGDPIYEPCSFDAFVFPPDSESVDNHAEIIGLVGQWYLAYIPEDRGVLLLGDSGFFINPGWILVNYTTEYFFDIDDDDNIIGFNNIPFFIAQNYVNEFSPDTKILGPQPEFTSYTSYNSFIIGASHQHYPDVMLPYGGDDEYIQINMTWDKVYMPHFWSKDGIEWLNLRRIWDYVNASAAIDNSEISPYIMGVDNPGHDFEILHLYRQSIEGLDSSLEWDADGVIEFIGAVEESEGEVDKIYIIEKLKVEEYIIDSKIIGDPDGLFTEDSEGWYITLSDIDSNSTDYRLFIHIKNHYNDNVSYKLAYKNDEDSYVFSEDEQLVVLDTGNIIVVNNYYDRIYFKDKDIRFYLSNFSVNNVNLYLHTQTQLQIPSPEIIFEGTFGGSLYNKDTNIYEFPSGTEEWAGFANLHTHHYPLYFPNGGKITFKAEAQSKTEYIKFRFENQPYPNDTKIFETDEKKIDIQLTEYTIEIKEDSIKYHSILLYIVNKGARVKLIDVIVTKNEPEPEPEVPVATGCFAKNEIVETDQGLVKISKLDSKIHTINNKKLIGVTKCIFSMDKIVVIKKNAFEKNKPSKKTIVSPFHMFIINNEVKPIYELINNRTIYWEKYDTNSILYNPIVEDRENIRVNNMLVDSAPHNQLLARIYDGSSSQEQIKKIKDFLNKYHSKLKNKPNKLLTDYRI